ncbi:NAD(P)/FAD-dependent oxidoreductase [Roseofilum reptotaenium CS-1145]|uniref:FAD/NAD(P)-binding domain-containing protein n=1 Tax=Roseofilum reptotaenium AO1-A TaxID=1925591 RepID=A0A1L9QY29_9CYAN|nr:MULTISPECIES: NAD(P)/FAD-dependent oxidoreductase [Roseofilum]MBP0028547.1 NAD(P)/FAD-dependent oxidoreductase [Roseofilum sp. Guam]MDB9519982.1 NAD(P)/FAD-dependent oxidoreductase [Roseofilum reptotaenium CS-1145]OJJ27595.1 hypothetical protein BI308_01110 [Roseofilum reptotaenium AO1-A]
MHTPIDLSSPHTSIQSPFKVCILGGGFGGLYAALYLQRFSELQVTLIDQNDHILFTPLLYELITNELQIWEIAPPFSKLIRQKKIKFYQDHILGTDLKKQQVYLQDRGELQYDYLIIAVGVKSLIDNVPGVKEHAVSFRTLKDTEFLKKKLQDFRSLSKAPVQIAIVGGGPSGVELATKIADYLGQKAEVRLITRGDRILRSFTKATRLTAEKALEERNVRISFLTQVNLVQANRLIVEQANETITLPTDLVIWTTGTKARSWVLDLDCEHNRYGQLLVEPTLQLKGYPEVFALGDIADIPSNSEIPRTAQAAYQQAPVAAKNLRSRVHQKRLKKFRYLHLGEMITVGVNDAAVSSFGLHFHGSLAFLFRNLVYLIRMPTISHRLQVFLSWLQGWWMGWVNWIFKTRKRKAKNYPTGIQ